jgi:flagellar biosynthetic protein FliR
MTLVFFPVVRGRMPQLPADSISLGLLMGREALVGLSLGLLSQVIFSAVEFCGQIVGTQMGFGAASLFDPSQGTQQNVMSVFQNLLATLLFMVLGMHHVFIRAIVESYTVVPLGAWHMSGELLRFVVATTTGVFVLAVKLAAPVMASLLAASMALGVMARAFPQMNIFMISFPLNIGLGFLVLGATLLVFMRTLGSAFAGMEQQMHALFRLLGG